MRFYMMVFGQLVIGCTAKDDDESSGVDSTRTGRAEFTVTDLDDPAGTMNTHWVTDSAQWWWATEDEAYINYWALHESDNQFQRPAGFWMVKTFQAGTRLKTCSESREALEQAALLLESVEEGDTTDEHCDALTEYFEQWDARAPLHDEITSHFGISWLQPYGPPYVDDGNINEEQDLADLYLYDRIAKPGDGWNPATCEFNFTPTHSEKNYWESSYDMSVESYDMSVEIDDVGDLVVGSIEADMTSRDGGSMHLEVTFEAVICQYSGGGMLQLEGEIPACDEPPIIVHEEVSETQSTDTDVLIQATIYQDDEDCDGSILVAKVYFRRATSLDWESTALTPTTEEDAWQGSISSDELSGMIHYYLEAVDTEGNTGRLPVDSSAFFSFEVSGYMSAFLEADLGLLGACFRSKPGGLSYEVGREPLFAR